MLHCQDTGRNFRFCHLPRDLGQSLPTEPEFPRRVTVARRGPASQVFTQAAFPFLGQ